MKKIKLALISNDNIGKQMAGPGIRYWELAKTLSKDFDTTLFAPDSCDINYPEFTIQTYNSKKAYSSIAKNLIDFDYVLSQSLRPTLIRLIKKKKIKYIADLYDPLIIENLEVHKEDPYKTQKKIFNFAFEMLSLQLTCADHILCASDTQKNFYLGLLTAKKFVNPKTYSTKQNFASFISILPFGLQSEPPKLNAAGLLEKKFSNIHKQDKIIYWGGGVWNWFDALSLVKAIEIISKKRTDIKLFFLGMKHPNPRIKQMAMANHVLNYCKANDLIDKFVFFNFDWTPYQERENYLLRASIGVSTHFDNLETRFSFRTRILDYLWAELPMILTKGDYMADLAEKNNLGIVVDYSDPQQIVNAVEKMIDHDDLYSEMKNNIKKTKTIFYWEDVASEMSQKILNNQITFSKPHFLKFLWLSFKFYYSGFKKKFF